MEYKKYITPEYTTGENIKKIRKELGLTQKEFAQFIQCSKPTVERWELSQQVKGPVVLLLECLKEYPDIYGKLCVPEKVLPIRLWYMHEATPCTLIDVDEVNKQIQIKNFTDNILFRAFGKEENPDYNQYQEFLKSRCFPESRDKLKLLLRELDLPFYDPFLIIEKTDGRMAEDHFWIQIEH